MNHQSSIINHHSPMDTFLSSRFALNLGLAIASSTPPRLGYAIARGAARWIASQRNAQLVQAVSLNQQQVAGGDLDAKTLRQAVLQVFKNTARSLYDLYHHLNDLKNAAPLFVIEPSFQTLIDRPKIDQRGLVIAGLHMTGFDLAYQWLCLDLLQPLGVTLPNPQGGRAEEFQRRLALGMKIVPGNFEGLRQALRYLKQGGLVVTGIDHPDPVYQPRPRFFGRPALLPTHHIFLALKAKVPVIIAASRLETDGRYHISASHPIEMDPYPDREEQLCLNAEKVLAVAETFIKPHPQQWLISQPVWEKMKD